MAKRLPRDPEKESAILTAAIHEFGSHGYSASTDKIAEDAGVSKGSVFRYFDNKKKLYVAAVNHSLTTIKDVLNLKVWTESDDLVTMSIRATKYKTELSHRYPDEFALLTLAYAQDTMIPPQVRKQVFDTFNQWQQAMKNYVLGKVIKKMNIRKDLDPDKVKEYLGMVLTVLLGQVQKELEAHPEMKKIEDMDALVVEVKQYLNMIEFGIVEKE